MRAEAMDACLPSDPALGAIERLLPEGMGPSARAHAWLRDGTPVRIRPIRPDDLELERRFVHGLSRETAYQRLMSGRKLLPGELERWTRIDPQREMALVAVATVRGLERELGVARWVREGSDGCDFAIVVGDRWQHQGLGETLLVRLIEAARDSGIGLFCGITLSTNQRMIRLARKLGMTTRREPGDATVTRVEMRLS
jgi:GNAT superfamily N-acetyltransferase